MDQTHLKSLFTAFEVANARWRKALSLGVSEFLVLFHLWMQDEPISLGEIGRLVNLSSGGLTAVVERLERGGYAQRTADSEDRRRTFLVLTTTGSAMRRQFLALILEHEELLEDLPPDQGSAVSQYLRTVTDALGSLGGEPPLDAT